MRGVHVRVERGTRAPALDHDQLGRIADIEMHLVENAAVFLDGLGNDLARLGAGFLGAAGLEAQFGDDVDH